MQTVPAHCNDVSAFARPSFRSFPFPCGSTPRRDSLDLSRPLTEAPQLERALSCSALPDARRARSQLQQARAKRGQINAASAVLDRELEREVEEVLNVDDFSSAEHKAQVEEARSRLEQYWNEGQQDVAAPDSPSAHRSVLEAQWQGLQKVRASQKQQSAAGRSVSSRRARRRTQPLRSFAAERVSLLQSSIRPTQTARSRRSSLSSDEQLLEKLYSQLGVRSGEQQQDHALPGSISTTPLLTKQQEVGLTVIIRRGMLLKQKQSQLQDSLNRKPSSAELQAETGVPPVQYAHTLQLAARGKQLMMRYNLRLVYSIARQCQNRGMEMDDMLPEGIVGLEKAIDRFEPEKGFRFSTYGHWWIRQHIHRALLESRIIRLPVHVSDSITRIHTARKSLQAEQERDRKVTDNEVASALGMPLAKVKQLMQLAQPIKSLDTPLWADEDIAETLQDSVIAKEGPTSEDDAMATQAGYLMENDVTALLQTLPVRERNVIRWRYGLWPDGKSLPLSEVGAAYGLTHERIRQIEESGLRKLRERSPAHFKKMLS